MVVNGRISGILAVSRSLGDYRAEKYVSRVPTCSTTTLGAQDKALVVACDGLFDVCTDVEVSELVNSGIKAGHNAAKIAKTLTDTALAKNTTDNVTVLVIIF
jgi:protein phosphatase PTC1